MHNYTFSLSTVHIEFLQAKQKNIPLVPKLLTGGVGQDTDEQRDGQTDRELALLSFAQL